MQTNIKQRHSIITIEILTQPEDRCLKRSCTRLRQITISHIQRQDSSILFHRLPICGIPEAILPEGFPMIPPKISTMTNSQP